MINAKTKLSNLEILLKCHDLSASRINETSFQLNTQYLDSEDYDKINSFFPAVVYEQKQRNSLSYFKRYSRWRKRMG